MRVRSLDYDPAGVLLASTEDCGGLTGRGEGKRGARVKKKQRGWRIIRDRRGRKGKGGKGVMMRNKRPRRIYEKGEWI